MEMDARVGKNGGSTHLIWEDVTVVAASFGGRPKRKLLNLQSGCALPNRMMAIMGPSGSGKSTLLDSLAGRLSPNLIKTGNVTLDGQQITSGCKNISYTTQEDHLLGTLTVRETLTYSAQLRLSSSMSEQEIYRVVDDTIMKMGLEECKDNTVGNWLLRGISGGEKRRLSIGLNMLTHPQVMFLDEPTSGLDSASAFFVILALRNIALEGRVVVCSIHQPSSYTFELFDDLCLLSNGETIYFGETQSAVKFFAEAGFPCPTRRNPSEHFLRCINSDFDKVTSESSKSPINMTAEGIKAILQQKYKNSEYSINTRKMIRIITLNTKEHVMTVALNKEKTNCWKQVYAMTGRSFVNMTRDMAYYWIRILFLVLISLSAGILYWDIGLSKASILDRSKCYTFFYDFLICLSVGALPSFTEEWKVTHHELISGQYGEAIFMLSNFISSFPFLATLSLSSGTIIYYMVKFHLGFSHYCCLCINIFCCLSTMEIICMIVALLIPNFLIGVGASAGVIMILTMASGLYRTMGDLPRFFWFYPMSYISFTSWAVQGQFKNDMIGLEFEPLVPGESKLKGEKILQTILGINISRSKWWDMAALFFLLFAHRVIHYMILKYKERAYFAFRRLYFKRTLQDLADKTSMKQNYGPSRRQQPLHPLSVQEGLSSPLN